NSYSWVNNEIRNMVFQHHEKLDGSGYPMHLAGDSISEMAKIVSVVDFYDALISERVYKKGLPPNVAYQAIIDSIPAHFDPRIVQAFQTFIVPYPVNSFVQLNTGETAKVLKVNRKNLMRPLLSIDEQKVDLEKDRKRSIVSLVVPTA
ncbi:MAG TPA: HD domain-containing phosphohydrolase, partial [Chroococcales cyanobacterium]